MSILPGNFQALIEKLWQMTKEGAVNWAPVTSAGYAFDATVNDTSIRLEQEVSALFDFTVRDRFGAELISVFARPGDEYYDDLRVLFEAVAASVRQKRERVVENILSGLGKAV